MTIQRESLRAFPACPCGGTEFHLPNEALGAREIRGRRVLGVASTGELVVERREWPLDGGSNEVFCDSCGMGTSIVTFGDICEDDTPRPHKPIMDVVREFRARRDERHRRYVPAAHALAACLRDGRIRDGMSVRDLGRMKWSGLTDPIDVAAGLEQLEALGWLQVCEEAPRGGGAGRRRRVIRLRGERASDGRAGVRRESSDVSANAFAAVVAERSVAVLDLVLARIDSLQARLDSLRNEGSSPRAGASPPAPAEEAAYARGAIRQRELLAEDFEAEIAEIERECEFRTIALPILRDIAKRLREGRVPCAEAEPGKGCERG